VKVLRQLQEEDLDAVVAVYREAWGESRPIDATELRSWLGSSEVDRGSLRVLETNGQIVGYGDVAISDGVVALEVAARTHWEDFLAWAEDTARTTGASRVRVASYDGDALANVAASRGYLLWRSSLTMRIDLAATPPTASPMPAQIEQRAFDPRDVNALLEAINEVFQPDPFFVRLTPARFREDYLAAVGMASELWMLAWDGDELVAFALGFARWHGAGDVGEVRSVGVQESWRRRGLGEALVTSAFRALHARGLRQVMLGVDASNETDAVRLYERVGMRRAQQTDFWARDL
jgi:mycothiol synthase